MTTTETVTTVAIRRTSNSETSVFKRCRRRWMLSQVMRIAPNGGETCDGPLWIGTLVHIGHDARFKALKWGATDAQSIKCSYLALKSVVHRRFKRGATINYSEVELARIMLEGYWEWEAEEGILAGYDIIDTEREMEMPIQVTLPNGEVVVVMYLGKADVIAINRVTNFYWIIDKKTVDSLTDPAFGLQRNEQLLGYLFLLEHNPPVVMRPDPETGELIEVDIFPWPEGAAFSMLRKVKRTARSNPPYYAHVTVTYNRTERRRYLQRLNNTLADMITLERRIQPLIDAGQIEEAAQIAYPTPTGDCSWECEFVGACDMFNDGSRVQDYLNENFSHKDPLARYTLDPHIEVITPDYER